MWKAQLTYEALFAFTHDIRGPPVMVLAMFFWLTPDEDVNADGSGADNDVPDILVVAAVIACVFGLRCWQSQSLAVLPPRLSWTLADQGHPLPSAPAAGQRGLAVGKLLSQQIPIRPGPGQSPLSPAGQEKNKPTL